MIYIKELKNFGAIKEIEDAIELNDLIIFMGNNSSGKSYLSMLIYSIINLKLNYYIENGFFSININFNSTYFNITFPPYISNNRIKRSIFNDIIKTLITTPLNSLFNISKSTYCPVSKTGYMQRYSILAENAISKTYMRYTNTQENTLNIIKSLLHN